MDKQQALIALRGIRQVADADPRLALMLDDDLATLAGFIKVCTTQPAGVPKSLSQTVREWDALPYAKSGPVPPAAPKPAAPQADAKPVATVIKNGAERTWMSENLGSLPDGSYSLYLGPQADAPPAPDVSAREKP